jgi:hypothetical protein
VTFQMLNQEVAMSVERSLERKLAEQELQRLAKAARAANAPADRAPAVASPRPSSMAAMTRLGRSFGRGLNVAARRRVPA